GPVRKSAEFYEFVAQNIGIWRSTVFILCKHVFHNQVAIGLGKIYLDEWDIERNRYAHRIEPVFLPGALQKFRAPYLDEDASYRISLAQQKRRRNRAINTA